VDILRERYVESRPAHFCRCARSPVTADGLAAAILRGETITIASDDLCANVIGRLVVKRVKPKSAGDQRCQAARFSLVFSDEPVMDLYTRSDEVPGSVYALAAFDFLVWVPRSR